MKYEVQNNSTKQKNDLKYRAYIFALNVIKLIDEVEGKNTSLQVIAKQLLRSATSVGANIVEAHGGGTKKDFTNYFSIALKSANETKFWLGLLRDSKKIPATKINPLLDEITQLANMLGKSILTLRNRK